MIKIDSSGIDEAYGFRLLRHLPEYRPRSVGDWNISRHRGGIGSSYLAKTCVDPDYFVLRHRAEIWMSTSLLEIESHAWHLYQAQGTVVVAGLGMGMFAAMAAAKSEVDRVIVGGIDEDVIHLVQASIDSMTPGWDKVDFVHADVLSPQFAQAVRDRLGAQRPDYLYADIWPVYPHPDAASDTRVLCESLHPLRAGWWGQEVSFGVWCSDQERGVTSESFEAFFHEGGVPLPLSDGYLRFCRDAMSAAGLDMEMEPAPSP